jgi:hypothetical protein
MVSIAILCHDHNPDVISLEMVMSDVSGITVDLEGGDGFINSVDDAFWQIYKTNDKYSVHINLKFARTPKRRNLIIVVLMQHTIET